MTISEIKEEINNISDKITMFEISHDNIYGNPTALKEYNALRSTKDDLLNMLRDKEHDKT